MNEAAQLGSREVRRLAGPASVFLVVTRTDGALVQGALAVPGRFPEEAFSLREGDQAIVCTVQVLPDRHEVALTVWPSLQVELPAVSLPTRLADDGPALPVTDVTRSLRQALAAGPVLSVAAGAVLAARLLEPTADTIDPDRIRLALKMTTREFAKHLDLPAEQLVPLLRRFAVPTPEQTSRLLELAARHELDPSQYTSPPPDSATELLEDAEIRPIVEQFAKTHGLTVQQAADEAAERLDRTAARSRSASQADLLRTLLSEDQGE